MSDQGERPTGAMRRVGPGEQARLTDDGMLGDGDTEGHLRTIEVGPGEHLADGDPTPASDDPDAERHV